MKGKCPFHNEKTPSFFVSPDRGTYYCFGCGAKGDIFSFVEQYEGLEFKQALVSLAHKAGVELVNDNPKERDEKGRLYEVMENTVAYFQSELINNKPVLEYLHKRGLTDKTIFDWRMGFARSDWRSLYDHLKSKQITESEMLTVGLIKKNETDTNHNFYDVFRGRIMFPIFDANGRPVAFSGRIFVDDDKSPKYLNSPATNLFNKSEVLYGFDRAKSAIRRMNYSILVEGQMDLILSHQAGLINTVASSGTALTDMHLQKLFRISPRVMFAFDSDSAGFNATRKSAELALRIGMEVKVASMPTGEDPASMIAKNPNLWKLALKDGKHIIDFYTDSLLYKNHDRRTLSREIKSAVLPFVLNVLSKTEQAHFVKSIAEKTGLKEEAVWEDLKIINQSAKSSLGDDSKGAQETPLTTRRQGIERRILAVIMWQEGKKDQQPIVASIKKRFVEIVGEANAQEIESALVSEKEKLIFEAEQYYEQSAKFDSDIEELFINLEEELLKEELGRTMTELHRAEVDKEGAKIENLLNQCQKLTSKLASLRKNK